MLITRLESN